MEDWFCLLNFCNERRTKKEIVDEKRKNDKLFKEMHDTYAKAWGRCTYEEQGYITEQILLPMKDIL